MSEIASRGCSANPAQHRCPKCNSEVVTGERCVAGPIWLDLECGSCGHKWARNIRSGEWKLRKEVR